MNDYFPLPMASLSFPNIDPILVQIGPLAVHWYGIGYIVGILFAWWYAKRLVTNTRLWPDGVLPMKPIDLDDFIVWAAVGVVLGGRTGYVLFYDLKRYIDHPLDIFAVWQGGMSFHGGLLGVILAMTLFSLKRGIRTWTLFDVVAAGVPVGLGLVRIANFVNAELWGRVTDVSWGVVFCNERLQQTVAGCVAGLEPRHPSQLYEALLEGAVLFLVLRFLTHSRLKLKTPRFVGGAFICGYGLSRIFVEFFREPDQQLGYLLGGWLTMGMVLSLPMVLAGIWAMATAKPAPQPQPA
ncbi:prolipoprotein diacylglyceryl transferase [Mesorhizobium sp. LSJC268A00]|uniref:prolipoprotein diacylglyceryl transferase n=1 Tax=unclassified Mesorhizobium TaxID=325217 RepID=UPI0003CE7744|nr:MULTISPECIES: prolipoprotein diacylglyceryl transferase [unclassified Mesorhizobium]ESW66649.1 prolipoprotein diacylglyceryl transferase [Mesorhizobium sp. LSJC277A00]ESW77363.1 prolipoprotein diacylglyceryl transferase [Mesorhizobium sp. LSJC285A00]ESX06424.1 prolipoprotein diacylglyceryl transferase [Mesorhizobium sp. LSJC268A00]ESX13066.1 prolipoprotein diacylglyceryl transferase [Mesorhizobium sp. LSJC265A00]ESX16545.1 prolipoprotein diacylglyceryl transferase [Mesorhizobium sp. LSJC255